VDTVIPRPKLPSTPITFNQVMANAFKPAPEPYPHYFRKRIDQKLNESPFKRFLMKTMIPMEEHNRRERKMTPEQRKRKWEELREEVHAIDSEPESKGIRMRADAYRALKRRMRRGEIKDAK